MPPDNAKLQHSMNRALDGELSEQELLALSEQATRSSDTSAHWEALQKTDRLLHTTPMVGPAPGFVSRVMAAVAAMPIPQFAQRHLGLGIALGLVAAAVMTIPVLSLVLLLVISALTDPGTFNTWLQTLINAATYVIELMAGIAWELESLTASTPALVGLVGLLVTVASLWAGLIWRLLGRARPLSH